MPNWCDNVVTIFGPPEALETLAAAAMDRSLLNTIKPIGDWAYDRAIETWGVKWDVEDLNPVLTRDCLHLEFESPWGPPLGAYHILEEDWGCHVEAYFYEYNMNFCGRFEDGGHESYELDNAPQDILDKFKSYVPASIKELRAAGLG